MDTKILSVVTNTYNVSTLETCASSGLCANNLVRESLGRHKHDGLNWLDYSSKIC